jgi:hypothetical protein
VGELPELVVRGAEVPPGEIEQRENEGSEELLPRWPKVRRVGAAKR